MFQVTEFLHPSYMWITIGTILIKSLSTKNWPFLLTKTTDLYLFKKLNQFRSLKVLLFITTVGAYLRNISGAWQSNFWASNNYIKPLYWYRLNTFAELGYAILKHSDSNLQRCSIFIFGFYIQSNFWYCTIKNSLTLHIGIT